MLAAAVRGGDLRAATVLLVSLLALAVAVYALTPTRRVRSAGKAVFITGCDTGFGRMLSLQLAERGFTVFAGCLTGAGVASLHAQAAVAGLSDRLFATQMDVTDPESVQRAAALVSSRTPCLHALVNNAGIGSSGLADWVPMSEVRRIMDVNFFGLVACTKAFMGPLTTADPTDGRRGRVVNVASVAGILGAPGLSAYCASKFAVEGWSDAVRREMAVWGVPVVLIEPSFLATPIILGAGDSMKKLWDGLPADVKERWGEAFFASTQSKAERIDREAEAPQLGVDAMVEAVTAATPRIRYKAGRAAVLLYGPLSLLPGWVQDALVATDMWGYPQPRGLLHSKGVMSPG